MVNFRVIVIDLFKNQIIHINMLKINFSLSVDPEDPKDQLHIFEKEGALMFLAVGSIAILILITIIVMKKKINIVNQQKQKNSNINGKL